MKYEIEKRAKLSEEQLESTKKKLSEKTEPKIFTIQTWLYKEPSYLRVRTGSDRQTARIAVKKGTYHDEAREEHEIDIKKEDIATFQKILESIGFTKPAYFESDMIKYITEKYDYIIKKDKYLGIIIEIEKITENKDEINKISQEVEQELKNLGLKELEADEYQEMMNKLYKEAR